MWGFFLLQRFSEGGIQIHKSLYSQDFWELHSESPALPFFSHCQLVFIASSLSSPRGSPKCLVGLCPHLMFSGSGLSFPVQPRRPASPLSGQHFTSHFFLQSLPCEVALRAFLELGKLLPSLPTGIFDGLFFNLPFFKALVFFKVTSFPLYPS